MQLPLTEEKIRTFFIKRFNRPPESDPDYYEQWQHRINHYTHTQLKRVMDSKTQKIWKEVNKK